MPCCMPGMQFMQYNLSGFAPIKTQYFDEEKSPYLGLRFAAPHGCEKHVATRV